MLNTHETKIEKDASGKKLIITRDFSAPTEKVWRAFSESELLEQWWAPRPYRAETKTMDFTSGGQWFYAMVGPEGDRQWCLVKFKQVDPQKSFSAEVGFADEAGNIIDMAPAMHWHAVFSATATGTHLTLEVAFDKEEDLAKIVEMGFKEGFTMALGNLDELLAS
jgi:uncharacterized protein YndB with AHSA1/START domain